jgi:hypothetical protein
LRAGGRTYFGTNDSWRIQGYTAYGFKDDKFKYVSGKWMVDKKKKNHFVRGNRRDIEQIGASLTDLIFWARSFASSSVFSSGSNGK